MKMADMQVDGSVDLRMVELHHDVLAGNPEMGCAEGEEGGGVETADPDDVELRIAGRELQLARVLVEERILGLNAGTRQQRGYGLQDAALGKGQHELVVRGHGSPRRSPGPSRPCRSAAGRPDLPETTTTAPDPVAAGQAPG